MVDSQKIRLFMDDERLDINHLFMQYSKPLFYYACKFVDEEPAKDIIQDVFLKLWNDRTIRVNKSLNGLLFTMVRNKCLQQLEKEKVRADYLNNAKLQLRNEEITYYSGEPVSIIQIELQHQLESAINKLPGKCREVFILSRFQEKKNREIAEETGISVKAVEKHITKALQIIRHELKDYLPLFFWLF
jgi:RNA polymerase sigma-70 factor, ECF subfamily